MTGDAALALDLSSSAQAQANEPPAPQRPTSLNGDWRGLREQHGQPAATANGVWRAPRSPMAARLLRPMHSGSLNLWQALSRAQLHSPGQARSKTLAHAFLRGAFLSTVSHSACRRDAKLDWRTQIY